MMKKIRKRISEVFGVHRSCLLFFGLLLVYDYTHYDIPVVVLLKEPEFSLLGPYNTTEPEKCRDTQTQLIDFKNFTFLINPPICENFTSGLLLMIIVPSNPKNIENRMVIRKTWGRNDDPNRLVFLVGVSTDPTLSNLLLNESSTYGDIIQGNFIDAYRNMTYKHVMGLKWVASYCPYAKYILKADDDIVVNAKVLKKFLVRELSPWGARDLIMCPKFENVEVARTNTSKWMVSVEEYAPKYYPTYCPGWVILYSQDVVPRLLEAAQSSPYFWIDDVYITGILAEKIKVPRTSIRSMIIYKGRVKYIRMLGPNFVKTFLFGPPNLNTAEMLKIWNSILRYGG